MGSKEGEDRRERGDRAEFLGGIVDVSTEEDSDKYALIPAARFNRQLTDEVGCR